MLNTSASRPGDPKAKLSSAKRKERDECAKSNQQLATAEVERIWANINADIEISCQRTGRPRTYFLEALGHHPKDTARARSKSGWNIFLKERMREVNEGKPPGERLTSDVAAPFFSDAWGALSKEEQEVYEELAKREIDEAEEISTSPKVGKAATDDAQATLRSVISQLIRLYKRTGVTYAIFGVRSTHTVNLNPVWSLGPGLENCTETIFRMSYQEFITLLESLALTKETGLGKTAEQIHLEKKKQVVSLLRSSLIKASGDQKAQINYIKFFPKVVLRYHVKLVGYPEDWKVIKNPSLLKQNQVSELFDMLTSDPPTLFFESLKTEQVVAMKKDVLKKYAESSPLPVMYSGIEFIDPSNLTKKHQHDNDGVPSSSPSKRRSASKSRADVHSQVLRSSPSTVPFATPDVRVSESTQARVPIQAPLSFHCDNILDSTIPNNPPGSVNNVDALLSLGSLDVCGRFGEQGYGMAGAGQIEVQADTTMFIGAMGDMPSLLMPPGSEGTTSGTASTPQKFVDLQMGWGCETGYNGGLGTHASGSDADFGFFDFTN